MEVWKDIKNYEGIYQVSNKGQVRSLNRKAKCDYQAQSELGGKMKTSELKKIVEREGLKFSKSHFVDAFYISNEKEHLAYINNDEFEYLTILKGINRNIAHAIVEYAYTPLEEREEVKKYRLKLPLQTWIGDYLYVGFNEAIYSYYLSGDKSDRFTQKEIDAMPFDTNFFIKEQV